MQGGSTSTELVVFRTLFRDAPPESYPSPSSGLTVSYWFKMDPVRTQGQRQLMICDGSSYTLFFSLEGADGIQHFRNLVESVNVDYSNGTATEWLVGRWQHFTLTTDNDPEQPNVKLYLDGKLVLDEHSNHPPADFAGSDGMCIGSHCDMKDGNVRMYVDHFHGELDELAFYKRALSAEEVAATYDKPREPEEDLVFYYDFEDSFDSSFVPNLGSSGSTFDLLLGSNHLPSTGDMLAAPAGAAGPDVCRFESGGQQLMCDPATKPSFLGSGAPLEGAGRAVVAGAVVGGGAVVIELPGEDDDDPDAALTFVVAASPDLGSVELNPSTGVATYSPPSSAAAASDTFSYTVASNGATSSPAVVRVILATSPTALDVSVTCVEDSDSSPIILDMRDPAGLPTSATLVTLPSYGSLSALDSSNNVVGTFDSTTELPVSTTLRLVYHPDEDNARTDSFTYTATNAQGLTSEPGRVEVTMFTINDDPNVDDPNATLDDANEELVISIEVVDPDDAFVSVFVNELPATGTLYYSGDDMTKPVEAYQPSFVGRIDQYAAEVLEFSTFWPSSDVDGITRKEVGSDCWNGLAVHAAEGYSEFFTVRYDESVYITAIEIGEPRGAGTVVSIEAYDYASGTWAQMWSGEPDVKRHNDHTSSKQYPRFQPDLCHPNFKTDVVRVKTDTTGVDDWNYLDYVKLSGFRDPPTGLVDPSSLLFVPPPNMDCVASFEFSLSDCAGGSSSRMFGPHTFSIHPPGLAEGGAECVRKDIDVLNIGLLLPMYNAAGEFQSFGPQYLEAITMAIEEINDKSDGINDELLPSTIIKYEWRDSAVNPNAAVRGVLDLLQDFEGKGPDVVLGSYASSGTRAAQQVLQTRDIPQLSPMSSATELKTLQALLPTLFRMAPTNDMSARAVADFFAKIDFTDVCFLGQPYDLYSVGGGIDFVSAAKAAGLNVLADVKTDADIPTPGGATSAMEELDNAGCRAVFVLTQTYAIETIVASANEAGFAGPESNWIWVFENTAAELINDPALAGTFVLSPAAPSGPTYDAFLERFVARGSSLGECVEDAELDEANSCGCSDATDDGGQLMFQCDHDNNITTPMRCAGYDYAIGVDNLNSYVAPAFGGDKLISALAQTSFDGITGPVSFNSTHRGREEGIAVTFKNNQGEAGPQDAGSWTTEGFEYPEGFTEEDIVWSTASGAMPKPAVTGGEAGVNTTFIAGIVAAAVVAVAAFCGYLRKRDKDAAKVEAEKADKSFERRVQSMRREVQTIEHMNTKLQEDVAHLQEYNQAEVAMLENRVKGFQADLAKVEEATGAAEQGMQRLMIRADELKGKSVVGKGAFGEVYKSEFRGTTVAVKTMVEVSEANLDRFQHEILLMSDLRHQNIVALVGACWGKDLMALVMEFCEKGMASDVLKNEGSTFSWDDPLLKWALDVARGMEYLHKITYFDVKTSTKVKGILHRDLKPDNCLVTDTFGLRIADFGEARTLDADDEQAMTQVGTPIFIAPEIVKGDIYSSEADVFSFALTLLTFALKGTTGGKIAPYLREEWIKAHPKKKANIARISHSLVMKEWRPDVDKLVGKEDIELPETAAALIKICWGDYPESRPNFVDIVEYVKHTIRAEVMGVELEVGDKLSKFLYPDGLSTTNRTAADTLSPTQNDGKKRRRTSDFLPFGSARTDPLLNPTCLSDHVHTFYGAKVANGVRPETTYEDMRTAPENSGNTEDNMSLYWHPAVYMHDKTKGKYELAPIWFGSSYYVWETGSATAFPDGFNMIAYGSTPEAHMEVTCDGPSECERDDCSTDDDSFFPQTACSELEAKLVFPTCWDGVNLTSETMTTHVSYDTEGGWFDAECPDSHPVKLPEVHFYFRIANYLGGEYTFADGTSVYHADYFSGWDAEKLQQILDGCSNESDAASPDAFCEDLLDFRVEKETGKQTEDDDIRGGLEAIQTTQDPDMQRTGLLRHAGLGHDGRRPASMMGGGGHVCALW
ncbi:hypothetical protein TeGR_g6334 [Tetraparma gracilis]|uniref:Protein kinase domain-containing protein n=1 Tax=Tetraparma gracilis TaxID=2962635 RepID=A0ABQ6N6W0_9STRA|nr:hypothetical protein TeGR_g6334 [Tetraparma gracilis]